MLRVRASPASLRCGPLARHIYPSLVLVQPRKPRHCLTERLLMGRKESNQTKKKQILLCENDNIDIIDIKPEKVIKLSKNLSVSKSFSPDNRHPFIPQREFAEKIYLPLFDIFQRSKSSGAVPKDSKEANITNMNQ